MDAIQQLQQQMRQMQHQEQQAHQAQQQQGAPPSVGNERMSQQLTPHGFDDRDVLRWAKSSGRTRLGNERRTGGDADHGRDDWDREHRSGTDS